MFISFVQPILATQPIAICCMACKISHKASKNLLLRRGQAKRASFGVQDRILKEKSHVASIAKSRTTANCMNKPKPIPVRKLTKLLHLAIQISEMEMRISDWVWMSNSVELKVPV